MVFSSNVFLFLFLPLFLAAYYLTPNRYRSWTIVAGSYVFYAWWRVDFLLLLMLVTVWNYGVALAIQNRGPGTATARRWVAIGVTMDLAVLGYFKYFNFGVNSLNAALAAAGFQPLEFAHVLLPIGISFFTFQGISYLLDVYRGDSPATTSLAQFAAFKGLFPQLIAGPVLRYKDLAPQFASRTHTADKFAEGSIRFMQGFIKKVFIADTLAPMVSASFALPHPTMSDAWLGVLAYTAQLYFDFSGYSDMAIGLGLMMGFRFIENFNQPYISQSITEFWRRWHISLSTWLRDYLYIPLGGNRHGTAKTYRNLLLTMLLGGLWHGANWTFVLWGAWHGTLLASERALKIGTEPATRPFRPWRWAFTLLLVMLGWVMFRAPDVTHAFHMYGAMFGFNGLPLSELYAGGITSLQLTVLALAYAVIVASGLRQKFGLQWLPAASWRQAAIATVALPVFVMAVLKLSADSYSPFLYFQF